MKVKSKTSEFIARQSAKATMKVHGLLKSQKGQGTTEYAIFLAVILVIAIVAVVAFRERIQELWTALAEGVKG